MKPRTLLFLVITLLVLILVPVNGAVFEWLGLSGILRADVSNPRETENPDSTYQPDVDFVSSANGNPTVISDGSQHSDRNIIGQCIPKRTEGNGLGHDADVDESSEIRGDATEHPDEQQAICLEAATFIAGIGRPEELGKLSLEQNHPNPFNSTTTIAFSIPFSGEATLEMYNILGQSIREIFRGHLDQGAFEITVDESVGDLASGIYFYRLKHEDRSLVRKMVLLR